MEIRLKLFFAQFISVNQLSIYWAVSDSCEEYGTCQTSKERPVLAEQSDPLFAPASLLMTTPAPPTEVPAQENSLQKYKERVEKLPQQDRLIKMCSDAGFLTTVEVGQYFMTKDAAEFSQFTEPVTCCEYILPRDEKSSDPKGWIRWNTKLGPYWESQPATCKVIWSENENWICKQRQFSLVGGHGFDRQKVRRQRAGDLWDVSRKNSRSKRMYLLLQADQRLKQNHDDLPLLLLIYKNCTYMWKNLDWYWVRNLFEYRFPVSKGMTTLLRHGHLPWEEHGSLEFWTLKGCLRNEFENSQHWSDEMWKSKMEAEETRKDFNIVLTRQDMKFFISELFKVIQDAIPLIPHYRTMC